MTSPVDEESQFHRPAYPERPGRWPDRRPDRWPEPLWPEAPRPERPRRDPFPVAKIVEIGGPVGSGGANRRADVIKAQIMLGNSGHYDLAGLGAPTGWPGGELVRAIRKYQKQKGLTPDGLLLPLGPEGIGADGTGETLAALREDVGPRLAGYAAPTPEEVDRYYKARGRWRDRADEDEEDDEGGLPEIIVAETGNQAGHPLGVLRPPLQTPGTPGAPPASAPGSRTAAVAGALNAAPTIVNLLRMGVGAVTGGAGEAPSGDASGSDATGSQAASPQSAGPAGRDQTTAPKPPPSLHADAGPSAPPALPRGTVLSDEFPLPPLQAQPGQQLAQVLPASPALMVPPPTGGKADPHRGENGVSPAEKQVGRMLEQRVGETVNLLNFAPELVGKVMRDPQAFMPTEKMLKVPPSEPIDEAAAAAAQTPPLDPPQVGGKLQGRPMEEREPNIEQLIPPEMKDWYGGLEPFDQELAKELMIVMNRWGDDVTQLGNQEFIREYLDTFKEEFRHVRGSIKHVAGGRDKDGKNVSEEYLPNSETGGVKGSSYPDVTFEFANHITESLYGVDDGERNRINTQTMQKRHPKQGVADERRRQSNLEKNSNGQPTGAFPKLRPDMSDGTVSEQYLEIYRQQARAYARENIAEWIQMLEKRGVL